MDLSRFDALYAAEAHEQLERLTGALLAIERGDASAAVTEAYRAMHTLKGVAATMGHDGVALLAHQLEDALELLRGQAAIDAGTVDTLLRRSDELRAAVDRTLQPQTPPPAAAVAPAVPVAPAKPASREVRVEQDRLDELCDTAAELLLLQARLALLSEGGDDAVARLVAVLGRYAAELHVEMLALRLVPIGQAFDRLQRPVRDLARQLGKRVELRIEGRDLRIDRALLEGLHEPLLHLVRNAIDHGIEGPADRAAAGKPEGALLMLRAERDRGGVCIEVGDDGRGIAAERTARRAAELGLDAAAPDTLLRVLSEPGFSTADQITGVSGRGIGLDAVVTKVRALGGALSLQTASGEGTTFVVRVPVTRALTQALRVRVHGEEYVIPLTHVAEAVDLDEAAAEPQPAEAVLVRGEAIRLVRLAELLGPAGGAAGAQRRGAAVIAEFGDRRAALVVDEIIGREQFLVKEFDLPAGTLPLFSGATLLADGRAALVLDAASLV